MHRPEKRLRIDVAVIISGLIYHFSAETRHAPIQPYDPAGTSHGPPRIRQQPCVSPWDAWRDGSVSKEAGPPTDSAGSAAAESQPAVSSHLFSTRLPCVTSDRHQYF